MRIQKIFIAASVLAAAHAYAGVTCTMSQKGDDWKVLCSEDGAGSSDFDCTRTIKIEGEGGITRNVTVNGVVARKAKDVLLWSDSRVEGKKITKASITGGQCTGR